MTQAKADRAARAARARQAGNQKKTQPSSRTGAAAEAVPAAKDPTPTQKLPQAAKAVTRAPAKRVPDKAPEPAHLSLAEVVQRMDLSQVQCRDFGHSWRPYSARWMPSYNSYESQLICQRCKTVRTRFLSRTGAQLNSAYDYAEGYLVKGMGRLTGSDRDVIRLASILAVVSQDTVDE